MITLFIGLENFQTRYLKSCHELGVELEGGRGRKRERERRGRELEVQCTSQDRLVEGFTGYAHLGVGELQGKSCVKIV